MKKTLTSIAITLVILSFSNIAKSQFNFIGGGIVLATGGEYEFEGLPYYNKSLGIDVRMSYDFNKKIKVMPGLRFYFPNKEEFVTGGESKTTVFAFNLDAHYIVNPRNNYHLYFLGGAHVSAWKIKDKHLSSTNSNDVDVNTIKFAPGLNLGGGMQFYIATSLKFYAEVKYVIAKPNQLAFSPGFLYEF